MPLPFRPVTSSLMRRRRRPRRSASWCRARHRRAFSVFSVTPSFFAASPVEYPSISRSTNAVRSSGESSSRLALIISRSSVPSNTCSGFGEQAVLQGVFRVLGVAEHAQRGLEQRAVIAAEERLHRLRIATLARPDQLFLIELQSHCHLRCHLVPLNRVKNCLDARHSPPAQCTGTLPDCLLGFFSSKSTGSTVKNTTPSILKLSINASMAACLCTVP